MNCDIDSIIKDIGKSKAFLLNLYKSLYISSPIKTKIESSLEVFTQALIKDKQVLLKL
jgi:hypothetical protein